jgi:hypothetical protein
LFVQFAPTQLKTILKSKLLIANAVYVNLLKCIVNATSMCATTLRDVTKHARASPLATTEVCQEISPFGLFQTAIKSHRFYQIQFGFH